MRRRRWRRRRRRWGRRLRRDGRRRRRLRRRLRGEDVAGGGAPNVELIHPAPRVAARRRNAAARVGLAVGAQVGVVRLALGVRLVIRGCVWVDRRHLPIGAAVSTDLGRGADREAFVRAECALRNVLVAVDVVAGGEVVAVVAAAPDGELLRREGLCAVRRALASLGQDENEARARGVRGQRRRRGGWRRGWRRRRRRRRWRRRRGRR